VALNAASGNRQAHAPRSRKARDPDGNEAGFNFFPNGLKSETGLSDRPEEVWALPMNVLRTGDSGESRRSPCLFFGPARIPTHALLATRRSHR